MKHIITLLLICISYTTACQNEIYQLALEHNIYSPVNNVITRYLTHQYRYPDNIDDLCRYIIADSCYINNLPVEKDDGVASLISYLQSPKSKYVSFGDSCFFFSKLDNTGCCEYGNPSIIINNIWDSRRWSFSTTFIKKGDFPCFDNTNLFDAIVKEIESQYDRFETITVEFKSKNSYYETQFYDTRLTRLTTISIRLVFRAEKNGRTVCVSTYNDIKSLNNSSKRVDRLMEAIATYDTSLYHKFDKVFDSDPDLESVLFISRIPFFNNVTHDTHQQTDH